MDPFSAEGELINLHNHFHQSQYQDVVDFDTAALSPENALPARVLQLRARVALGQADDVLADVQGEAEPELEAVAALAEPPAGPRTPWLCCRSTKVIVLEAVALIVQIHLQQNRTDLALKEVVAARIWAQDSLLVNLVESWVGLRLGGEKYQQASYVFEELAQAPATSSVRSLVSQAVAELHLGRTEEAQAALEQALKKEPAFADAIADLLVLSVITGKDTKELTRHVFHSLGKVDAQHPLLTDLAEKSDLFDKAATKYKAKVAA
ncbi:coatomer epsilon subunit-domain-containing protein [Lasiosphaeria ovina]|uniref:Coatomer epsilon subunit-domain-containing protein n=1 Tax=Lasiosphaeria ovina TaxID=92902 RepID=A0AAE0N8L2_9PEZI|nr:coatomer epsilon subunit-domain-containing protein [Lasiosphaeria ovina]